MISFIDQDLSRQHFACLRQDFEVAKTLLVHCIEEVQLEAAENPQPKAPKADISKRRVFVSHAAADKLIADELVEFLEGMGLDDRVFCSSTPGCGVDLGANFLEVIKQELTDDTLVLFLLSDNFYKSPYCLCEMGTAWVLSKEHIPIVIPPFEFSRMKGVIPHTTGFIIDDPNRLTMFKDKIESVFEVGKRMFSYGLGAETIEVPEQNQRLSGPRDQLMLVAPHSWIFPTVSPPPTPRLVRSLNRRLNLIPDSFMFGITRAHRKIRVHAPSEARLHFAQDAAQMAVGFIRLYEQRVIAAPSFSPPSAGKSRTADRVFARTG